MVAPSGYTEMELMTRMRPPTTAPFHFQDASQSDLPVRSHETEAPLSNVDRIPKSVEAL